MRTLVASLIAALLLLGTAQAQPTDDPGSAVNRTVDDTKSVLDKTLDGVNDAADGVDAAEKTGDGVGKGASAVGRALVAAAKAIGGAAQAVGKAIGSAAAATGRFLADASVLAAGLAKDGTLGLAAIGLAGALGLSGALLAAGSASASGLTFLGSAASSGLAFAGLAAAGAGQAIGGLVRDGVLAYVGLIGQLRPDAVPAVVFGSVAVTGAAASTGVGGWAGWSALRKWGLLGSGAGVAGFSRIADDDLLEHPLRGQIFQVIQSNPGIHASGLARQVGVGWGTITHHLEKLEKGHLVATRKINNQKCFFENGGKVSRLDMAVAGAVKGDTASDIAGFVLGHPMTSQKDMAAALGISPALVSFHVKKLVNLGVLDKVRHGKETLLTTSEALRRVLAAEKSPVVHAELKDESFSYTS
jgi:DNA-binding transcriptional ArsR family regulator